MQSIPCGDHRGYAMEYLSSYYCSALGLYGYSTDLALTRAIDRKLNRKRFTIAVFVDGVQTGTLYVFAQTSKQALQRVVKKARQHNPNATSWEATVEATLNQ